MAEWKSTPRGKKVIDWKYGPFESTTVHGDDDTYVVRRDSDSGENKKNKKS